MTGNVQGRSSGRQTVVSGGNLELSKRVNGDRKDKYVDKFKTGLDIIFLIDISLTIIDY